MNSINLNPLKLLIRQCDAAVEELEKLATIEREANATIEKILEDGRVDEVKEQQALASSRLRLDLVPARRKKLLQSQPKAIAEMRAELRARRDQWNRFVRECTDGVRAEVVAANAPFFPDKQRELKKLIETFPIPIPAIEAVRRATEHASNLHDTAP